MKTIMVGGERNLWARKWGLALLTPLLLAGHGCDDDSGVTDPSTRLDFLIVEAPTVAALGDCILVHWDYRNPNLLGSQELRLFSLNPNGSAVKPLTRNQRDFTFIFEGPVTVEIFARDTSNRELAATFDIDMDSSNRFIVHDLFRAQSDEVNTSLYPRLPTGKLVSFPLVIGLFDEDGDGVLNDALRLGGAPDREFFAHAESDREDELFDWALGAEFPFRRDGLLSSERADAVIIAAKLVYGARGVVVALNGKGRTYFKNRNSPIFPVYATVDLARINNNRYQVVDIHMGDFRSDEDGTPYGFTLSRYKNIAQLGEAGAFGGEGMAFRRRAQSGTDHVISAETEAGRLGHSLILADRTPVFSYLDGLSVPVPGVFASFSSIEWRCLFVGDESGGLEELVNMSNYGDTPPQTLCSLQDLGSIRN